MQAADLSVDLRSRVEAFKGSGQWLEARLQEKIAPARTAIIVCDMWDKHWCGGATARVSGLVKQMDPFLEAARRQGSRSFTRPRRP